MPKNLKVALMTNNNKGSVIAEMAVLCCTSTVLYKRKRWVILVFKT